MKARSITVRLLLTAALALLVPRVYAQDGFQGALAQAKFGLPFQPTVVMADLDNDKKPDGAVLLDSSRPGPDGSFRIQLHFTGRPNTELTFESQEQALTLDARDINNDGDPDLVVEQAFTHKPVHVWINEGHGDFHEGRVQDFPALAVIASQQLQSPLNHPGCRAVCLPQQRGFEIAIFFAPLYCRPPSSHTPQLPPVASLAKLRPRSPESSRAPPLV